MIPFFTFLFNEHVSGNIPAIKGIPRYMKTLCAICSILIFTILPFIPNNGGKMVINTQAYTL